MPLIVWLASAALASSLPLAWWALSGDRQLSQRVSENLAGYQPTMRQAVLQRSAAERFLLPVIRSVGVRFLRFTPAGWIGSKNLSIAKAGLTGRVTAEQLLGAKFLLPVIVLALLGFQQLGNPSASRLLFLAASLVAAFVMPDLLIRSIADRRAEKIELSLPDLLDQLTISVEAGLGFEAALARITESNPEEPLAQDFGRMLQDVQLGTSRVDALDTMSKRAQVDDLRTMVIALRQSEALGVPLAETLRALAQEMREKRRFRAEERAHRLPVLMIFPLGLCILPALFIVILGPPVISIFEVF
jgi:tight adherence protein C